VRLSVPSRSAVPPIFLSAPGFDIDETRRGSTLLKFGECRSMELVDPYFPENILPVGILRPVLSVLAFQNSEDKPAVGLFDPPCKSSFKTAGRQIFGQVAVQGIEKPNGSAVRLIGQEIQEDGGREVGIFGETFQQHPAVDLCDLGWSYVTHSIEHVGKYFAGRAAGAVNQEIRAGTAFGQRVGQYVHGGVG